jgi:hypothetical protein
VWEKFGLAVFRDSVACLEFQTKSRGLERLGFAVLAYVHVPRCVVTT